MAVGAVRTSRQTIAVSLIRAIVCRSIRIARAGPGAHGGGSLATRAARREGDCVSP